jgi:hypothetical protein
MVALFLSLTAAAQSWQSGPGYRFRSLGNPPSAEAGFTALAPQQTGIGFTNLLPQSRHVTNQILPNGSGVAAGDIDGDGWCDLYFCGLNSSNRLYRNLGNWRFADITDTAGAACPNLDATGALLADLDGDGDLDLVVNSIGGGTHLYLNDGRGRFTASASVLNPGRGGSSVAAGDFDGDGDLDLYVANYRVSSMADAPNTRFSVKVINGEPRVTMVDGRPVTAPDLTNRFNFRIRMEPGGRGKFAYEEFGEVDALYLNDGGARFSPVSFTGGAFLDEDGRPLEQAPFDWGLTVIFRDLNGDLHPDLYVCNDFSTPDRLWLNDGRGGFRAVDRLAIRQTSLAAMAVDVADIDRDGHDDLLVTDMLSRRHHLRLTQRNIMRAELAPATVITARPQYPRNVLQASRGDGTYAEIAQLAGVEASEWSWSPIFLDVDLDGYEDLLIPNGFERDNMSLDTLNQIQAEKAARGLSGIEELKLRARFRRLTTPNLAFRNLGGFRFAESSAAWRFDAATISQGACLADLDNDGDLDVILNNMNAVAGVYRNDAPRPRLGVRLRGLARNTCGIGSKIRVYDGAVPMQSQEIMSGGRYLSSDEPMRVFAAGTLTNRLRIEVAWRSGRQSVIRDVLPNRVYEIDEASAEIHQAPAPGRPGPNDAHRPNEPIPSRPAPEPWFEDLTHRLGHRHADASFDDFARQPLLPRRLSQAGPGLAWHDLDGNGTDDLIIGGGRGGQWAVFLNEGQGRFRRRTGGVWEQPLERELAAVLGAPSPAGLPAMVLAGEDNYEDGPGTPSNVVVRDAVTGAETGRLPTSASSTGPLALADIEADGDLDLFVGGRVIAGRYPEPATSRLFRLEGGHWTIDERNRAVLEGIGLVNGAVFTDLNGDGYPELVLACEWGPVKVLVNEGGTYRDRTREWGMAEPLGWWQGVNAGDFDGDGRLDLLAGNWGRNTKYQWRRERPLRLYYGDFDGDGVLDLLEAHYEPSLERYVPERMLDVVSKAMPFLTARFPTHAAYAQAGIDEILADRLDRGRFLEANWLETTLFLNRGNRFEAQILPAAAQWSPVFGVAIGDANGDGREDAFLSQNFFAVEMETSRYDAGRGLWLEGDGHGQFRPVPGQKSGVMIYGEQRAAALADFDADGRMDLAVAQHGGDTRLFRNLRGRPGLRVRLRGPALNPCGIGAVMRLKWGNTMGPAREIHAGGGYWSQDSAVQVLGAPETPTELWIRWPGGATTTVAVPPDAREISVHPDGRVSAP